MMREDGFTVVEVLVALVILVVGAMGVLTAFDAATRNTFRADQQQVALNRAQQELEQIRQMPYEDVALNRAPALVNDKGDPRYRINGSGQFALGWDGTTPSNYAAMDVDLNSDPTSLINPGPTPFTSGDVSGKVYRFVVWQNDPGCPIVICPGDQDYKRVVVVVAMNGTASSLTQNYVEVQSNVSDPNATTLSGRSPDGGPLVTTQQFFLSDTPCYNASGLGWSNRDAIGDHAAHNTLGNCGTSVAPGTNPPDGLYASAPSDPDPNDPNNPTEYEFASDLSPLPPPARGLQMPRQTPRASGQPACDNLDINAPSNNPVLLTNASGDQYKIHRWVTQPMSSAFTIAGTGTSAAMTLKLWTATTVSSPTAIPAGMCAWLFVRTNGVDTYLPNADSPTALDSRGQPYFRLTESDWPQGQWTAAPAFLMNTASGTTVPAGSRLGLAIAVNGAVTAANQNVLEFMYDYPDEASRLEVQTTTPLP
jgi:prepilin-type N-terminal cleavage/methylation domain-containing protein